MTAVTALLRPMETSDLPGILALEPLLFPDDQWSEQSFRDELGQVPDSRWYVVAERDAVLVGYAGIMFGVDQADILTLAVAPEHQDSGVGRALLDALLLEAAGRRVAEVLLEVRADNVPALRLYKSAGFEQIARRRGYYANGSVDGVVLRRRLE
jgi:[ribosomal protein S18]-alanine N-acetyltransferase